LHQEMSGMVESAASGIFYRAVQQRFADATITGPVRLRKTFPSMSSPSNATDSYRRLVPFLPASKDKGSIEWTQDDPRLSAVSPSVEVDLFVKFAWLGDSEGATSLQLYRSPPSSRQTTPPGSPVQVRWCASEGTSLFTGCAVGEVTRADLLPRSKSFDRLNPNCMKLIFKFIQLERAIIAAERYYVSASDAADTSASHPVKLAALSSSSFCSLGSWDKKEVIDKVLGLDAQALVNLRRLHHQQRLFLL
jgi:hypothetical protein